MILRAVVEQVLEFRFLRQLQQVSETAAFQVTQVAAAGDQAVGLGHEFAQKPQVARVGQGFGMRPVALAVIDRDGAIEAHDEAAVDVGLTGFRPIDQPMSKTQT